MKDETKMPPRYLWSKNWIYDEKFLRCLQRDDIYSIFEEEILGEGSRRDLSKLGEEWETVQRRRF